MCERASQERDQTTKLEQVLNDLVVGEEGGGGGGLRNLNKSISSKIQIPVQLLRVGGML